jgi:hypothetical protein
MNRITYLLPVLLREEAHDVRSRTDNSLLARTGKEGIYLWNRRSKQNEYLWRWEDILQAYEEECKPISGTQLTSG